jgi:hypothetical protein
MPEVRAGASVERMNNALTVVAIVVVVAVLAVAAWAFVIAPFVVPWRHANHH